VTTDPTSLTRFQRMLLGTDGTVTHMLEAYADEPVEVVKLLQEVDTAEGVDPALDVAPDDKVLRRRVVLRGRRSGRNLLYAEALVAIARVAPDLVDGLLATERPIGVLLAEGRTETFREILRVDREPAGALAQLFGIGAADDLIWRTYRILMGRRPVMVITEKFPASSFRDLPA